MKSFSKSLVALSISIALTTSAGSLLAQSSEPMGGMASMQGMQGMQGMPGKHRMHGHHPGASDFSPERQAKMAENHKKRLSKVHEMLKLRSDQEGAWTTFNEAMQAHPDFQQIHQMHEQIASMNTLQRLDKFEEFHKAQSALHQKKIDAVRQFYGKLDSSQQKTFDSFPPMMMATSMPLGKFKPIKPMDK